MVETLHVTPVSTLFRDWQAYIGQARRSTLKTASLQGSLQNPNRASAGLTSLCDKRFVVEIEKGDNFADNDVPCFN